ncbi:MAG TPA: toll/interleukin-1 receptor domain-containing protein [bacterium]|jgi:hypothetical protein
MKDRLFISHANPIDNEFSLWLTLRLRAMGFQAWCDLTDMPGGASMWPTIERQIRANTDRFIFVLSKVSNHQSDGCLKELAVADAVRRSSDDGDQEFILPVRCDDIDFKTANAYVIDRYTVDFFGRWGAGLRELLDKLKEAGIVGCAVNGPSAVSEWWAKEYKYASPRTLLDKPETYVTNVFPITRWPSHIFIHDIGRSGVGPYNLNPEVGQPFAFSEKKIISFFPANSISSYVTYPYEILNSTRLPMRSDAPYAALRDVLQTDDSRLVTELLTNTFEYALIKRGLRPYLQASKKHCFFFYKGSDLDSIQYDTLEGAPTDRVLVGKYESSYWHFAISAKAEMRPFPHFAIRRHVLFSDDARTIWESKPKLHKARRSACRRWFNELWRERLLAAMACVSRGTDDVLIEFGDESALAVSRIPTLHECPKSYIYGIEEEIDLISEQVEDQDDEDIEPGD